MKKSILKSTALVLCAGLVCCLLLTAAIFDAKTTQQTETQLRSLATALGSAYDANGDADAQASQFSRQIGGLRVTVIAKDGTVLGDSAADYKTMENHAGREELKAAEGAGVGISVRPSETLGTRLMYAAVRTQGGDYIRVAMQYNGFLRDLVSLLPALLGAGLVAFAVAAFVATRVAKTVTDPISDFTESLKNVQEGGARLEPEKYPYEELQAMAGDINRMSEEIARNMRRLEREKAKIDYILDNMNEGFVLLDTDQNILLINASACRAFGVKKTEAQGKNILHATRNIPLIDGVAAVLKKGGHVAVDMPLPDKRKGEVNISRVKPEDTGAIDGGAIIIISDVTAQRNAAKMRQDFFESASHELKTPITSIKGFAELLAAGTLSEEKSAEALALIASEADRLASVANRLTEGEDAPLSLSSFDLSECVHRLTLILDGKAKKRGVSFCEKGFSPDEPHYVRADERAIREVLYNLCDNAVKYADENTPVTVALSEDGGRVYASIENICRDFDPADGEKIFSAGYRGRSGTASVGSGLGLSIARSLLLRHGQECAPVFSFENGVLRISFSLEKAPEYSEYTETQGEGEGKGKGE